MSEFQKDDIDRCIDRISKLDLSWNSKNKIIESVTKPLRYAYKQGWIDIDLSNRWVRFTGGYRKRNIFTHTTVKKLLDKVWKNDMAKIAFTLSIFTGMRCGEILALREKDIGNGQIFVNHSWSRIDGLKSTKNGEKRIVECPFPCLLAMLRNLLDLNPCKNGDRFVFWGKIKNKPIDEKIFIKNLRYELEQIGMSKTEANSYEFHSCRHYFTTCMYQSIDNKTLQLQTGHKDIKMLEHYANHELDGDRLRLSNTIKDTFKSLL